MDGFGPAEVVLETLELIAGKWDASSSGGARPPVGEADGRGMLPSASGLELKLSPPASIGSGRKGGVTCTFTFERGGAGEGLSSGEDIVDEDEDVTRGPIAGAMGGGLVR